MNGDLHVLPVPGGEATQAYITRLDDAPHPGVLFFMDAIGLRPRIYEMADTIASWGYVVLAPNVFYREGTVEQLAPTQDLREPEAREAFMTGAMERVQRLTAAKAQPDIAAYVNALTDLPGVTTPIGVTGYCMGARLAIRAAASHPQEVAAVGGFHGGGLVTPEGDSPHLALEDAKAEFLFGHADADPSMTPQNVTDLGRALREAGLTGVNEILPGAPHGYTMSDTSSYDEGAANWHFERLRDLLDRRLLRGAF